ncbi:hypothetical protein [Chryseobacterium fistulae]|uniref:Uncharacterized protein n=1 Tax=Chryseobacterium fistulae TaxID=2675058 RepID=A0A6N4XTJ3_9FLAO|nr:hypothetical protein [Chryseobacterium fistulae]CAA7387092.1 hypothetical protein CHRY9393_01394 [Chryseobacterium fistulae]
MNCYTCSLNLCTIYLDCNNNASVDLNFPAPENGEYILYLKYLNIVLSFSTTFQEGENLLFNLTDLNEHYAYSFHIMINGEKLFVNNDMKSYDNFTFRTRKEWKIS